jgi:prephenate dehydrogenase
MTTEMRKDKMESTRQRITIIGTGCIGTSIGLALRQSKDADHLEIVGHDREHGRARFGQKMGAFDRAVFNLDLALDTARLVILAVPLAELRQILADVGRLLEPGAGVVVTDTAPMAVSALNWADELLPSGNHFIPADPLLAPNTAGWEPLRGQEDARVDLFHKAVYAIVVQGSEHPSAVRAVNNLALVLGSFPYFIDPVEHDAVRMLTDAVPDLVATALFTSISEAPGWGEVRQAAGRSFATATAATAGDTASRRMLMQLGRTTLLRGVEAVMDQLTRLHSYLSQGDIDELERVLAISSQSRDAWMVEALSRDWQSKPDSIEHDNLFGRTMRTLFGEGIAGKR